MSKKNISDYLPQKTKSLKLVQAKVNRAIFEEFKLLLKADQCSFKSFVEAAMLKFIDEKKRKAVS